MKRLITSWVAILIVATALAGCAQDNGNTDADSDAVASVPTATATVQVFDDPDTAAESDEPEVLHAPVVVVLTNTPPAVTNTPEPTATPEQTATPEATAVPPTSTPAPVQPTSPPPPPPPTAVPPTEPPPPPPPPPIGANGLVASYFALTEDSEFKPNKQVWFEFVIANQTGNDVPYNSLGVMPNKDGNDRVEWYQQSYSGRNSTIGPGGFEWKDNIKLPETGDYTLRLVICFDGFEPCTTGQGPYQSLSGEIPITIK